MTNLDINLNLDESTQKDRFLTFFIGEESYGIEIKYVIEIIGIHPITKVPQLPKFMKGIINLRGKIIPILDLRIKFNKEEKPYTDRTCIIIISSENSFVGLVVDNISEVTKIPPESISIPQNYNNKYVKGIGRMNDQVKLLIDCDSIFGEDRFDTI